MEFLADFSFFFFFLNFQPVLYRALPLCFMFLYLHAIHFFLVDCCRENHQTDVLQFSFHFIVLKLNISSAFFPIKFYNVPVLIEATEMRNFKVKDLIRK